MCIIAYGHAFGYLHEQMKRVSKLLIILCLVYHVSCDRIANETLLKKKLMNGYEKSVLPTFKINTPVVVNFNTRLRRIIDINEVQQSIQVYMWGRQSWTDPRLAWNASDYDGITNVNIMSTDLWLPDTTLYSRLPPENFAQIPVSCDVNNKGTVLWLSPVQLTSTCLMNLQRYPNDEQTCEFVFGSWGNDGGKIDYTMPLITDATSEYKENEQWDLVDLNITRHSLKYSCCPNPYIDITFTLKVKRDRKYPIMNFVVPSVLLSILSILTFLLPPESGERITLSITILLSTTLFQQLTASLIPPSQVPVISLFYFSSLLLNCLSLVATTFILRSYFHTTYTRMNRCLYTVGVVWLGCLMQCRCKRRRTSVHHSTDANGKANIIENRSETNISSTQQNEQELATPSHVQISSHEEQQARYKEEWLELVLVLDRFCVVLFTILIGITGLVIWFEPSSSSSS